MKTALAILLLVFSAWSAWLSAIADQSMPSRAYLADSDAVRHRFLCQRVVDFYLTVSVVLAGTGSLLLLNVL